MIHFSNKHRERSFFYSPLSFLRIHKEKLIEDYLTNVNTLINNNTLKSIGTDARCFYRYLEWDSEHLNIPTYRIEFCDWNETIEDPLKSLSQTFLELRQQLLLNCHERYYLFAEIPSEDITTIQALNNAGLNLVETRLFYYDDNLTHFSWADRYNVRQATIDDIPRLRNVAIKSRNNYDRLHADPLFSDSIADGYLGTFVENSVRGFTDMVLVPNDDHPTEAFFAGDIIPIENSPLKISSGRMVVSAAGETRRGWHLKLMSEMCFYLQKCGVQMVYANTQPTNRAVVRNFEKLGWKYGKCTHVFSAHGR